MKAINVRIEQRGVGYVVKFRTCEGEKSYTRPNKLSAGITKTMLRGGHKLENEKLSLSVRGTTDKLDKNWMYLKPVTKTTYILSERGKMKLKKLRAAQ